jgi:prepilin-type N-terminal cleavage/methylation domain-containing protein
MKKIKGFTLIESMIVLFIISLLSTVSGIGYGIANRSKKIEQAGRKINTEIDATRNYAVFGQEVNGKFPCGYGIILNKNQANKIGIIYTSGSITYEGQTVELTREGAMEKDFTCDQLINSALNDNQAINFSSSGNDNFSSSDNTLVVSSLSHIIADSEDTVKCFAVLFSAPRGAAYYFADSANCPAEASGSAKFNLFSETTAYLGDFGANHVIKDTNYFLTKLQISEGFITSQKCHKTYPSGNGIVFECP